MNRVKNKTDLVSIIIPVYNMEKSLEGCVQSVLNQDYENIEVILVDDGSKDNSFAVCQKISAEDKRVRCVHIENQGSGPARNVGISESKGRYLYFPDADDYIESDAISTLVDAMCDGKYDLVVFGYKILTHDGNVVSVKGYENFEIAGEDVRKDYGEFFGMTNRYSIQGAPWNKFFDGETMRKNNITYPSLRRHQDEGFIARYVTCCKNVRFIPNVLYSYYQNTSGMEWKKYPVDYIDAVVGLRDVWNDTIVRWNRDDINTHVLVEKTIFSKIIKALELSYSPKMELKFWSRIKWLSVTCKNTYFTDYSLRIAGSMYQRIILICAKLHIYLLLSFVLYIGKIKNIIRQGK